MVSIFEADNGRTVDVRVGETARITLSETASTGYRWAIDRYDAELVEAVATEPHYAQNAVGSGGEIVFIFRGRQAGTGEIVLKSWRRWEGDSSVAARFCVSLRMKA